MKRIIVYVLGITTAAIMLYALVMHLMTSNVFYSKEDSIKIGQTWKYSFEMDNPFKKGFVTYKEVIDIKGDYVLYIRENGDTASETKRWFVVCGEILN